ncbi:NUDIX domain-containing protein [Nocardioides sp. KIGAM211]|uniref:NUDIX domain-containing protein n=1 Tax=Nocardioides luti TaxID=2761101 RepID=A0A7X0V9Q2_9ACTN|nr:NUDIX domain-containing protein [Nocardioides luti]
MHRFSSVALVDPRGWVLLQERDEHPVIDPERWGFPGGSVEEGETYEQAAYRELEEETGVRLDGGLEALGPFLVFHEHCGQDDEFTLFVGATTLTDAGIECHEGRQMVFVDPAVAPTLDLTAAAGIALPALLDSPAYAAAVAPTTA